MLLTALLVFSFLLKLNHLGHEGIKALDESFHALVAKHLIAHPLTPTLFERDWLPQDYRQWQASHIWLHKPIVPLWTMAASMALFGVNTLAMRLPSAILATAAVWLTYAIGKELLDWRAALIAATLQAFNPGITSLVQGYLFSDHVDVAFLFWVELAAYLLVRAVKSGSLGWTIAAGVAQAIAFLSKTYPAFIITGIALAAWLLPVMGFTDRAASRFRGRHLLILLTATIVAAAPWMIWCYVKFRPEFLWEQVFVFRHLTQDVEHWAAPWDRLIFDFSIRIYHLFYPAVIVAAVLLAPRAWRERNLGLWLLFAWGLGVLIPHVLATSKTPTATLIGWPPFLLLLGAMMVRAVDGDAWCLGGWAVAALLALVVPGTIPHDAFGYPNPPVFGAILRQNIWVVWHVLAALAAAAVMGPLIRRKHPGEPRAARLRQPLVVVGAIATILLTGKLAWLSYKVTRADRERPAFADLGAAVDRDLPPNAVLLLEIREKLEHIIAMFWIDRTVYPVVPETIQQTAAAVRAAGGEPFLVTDRQLPLPTALPEPLDGRWVYVLPGAEGAKPRSGTAASLPTSAPAVVH